MSARGGATARPGFRGASVALLEARLAAETAAMVRRLDGVPIVAPALVEETIDADHEVGGWVDRLAAHPDQIVVFLTGSAATRLFAAADRLGREAELAAGLRRSQIVVRGPKPAGALSRRGVTASLAVAEPFTTADVVLALESLDVAGRSATVVHYGERNGPIVDALAARGAVVHELMLYRWRLPDDAAPLSRAIDDLIARLIPVVAFTSQIQVRHLIEVAGASRVKPLVTALNRDVLVGAVGPTCAAACAAAGIDRPVVPAHPRLAALLHALAEAHAARA